MVRWGLGKQNQSSFSRRILVVVRNNNMLRIRRPTDIDVPLLQRHNNARCSQSVLTHLIKDNCCLSTKQEDRAECKPNGLCRLQQRTEGFSRVSLTHMQVHFAIGLITPREGSAEFRNFGARIPLASNLRDNVSSYLIP